MEARRVKWTPGGRREAGSSWTYGARSMDTRELLEMGISALRWSDWGRELSGEGGSQRGEAQAGGQTLDWVPVGEQLFIYWRHRGLGLPLSCHHGASHHLTCYLSHFIYVAKRAGFRAVFRQCCLLLHAQHLIDDCLAFVEWIHKHILYWPEISHSLAEVEADLLVMKSLPV